VNGHDFEFLVDTGSAYTAIALPTARYLQTVFHATPGVRIAPAHGPAVQVPTARLHTLSVGGHMFDNVTVVSAPSRRVVPAERRSRISSAT
jgi:predicted aspartyl protease